MALKIADVMQEMKAVLADQKKPPLHRFHDTLNLAAGFLRPALGRTGEKSTAAVLMLDAEHSRLSFAYPRHLASGNYMPSDPDSIAGRVAQEKKSMVFNKVAEEPHKDFFERIPDDQGSVRPIQKMIAAPLLDKEGNVFGVVEVNRTGNDLVDAGPDFSSSDAQNLEKCCKAFAPFVMHAWAAAGKP
ncbi:MAG: GAF domain-containing protein [Thermoanaerobaculia bacterium]|nr:GAF domain-containing protein [Thermoanaerobaculia bacterium]